MNNKVDFTLNAVAIVFVIWVFAWGMGKIQLHTTASPYETERWSNASSSDFLTMKAGKRFHEEGFVTHHFLNNMTVGFEEFSRGWYSHLEGESPNSPKVYNIYHGSLDSIVNAILRIAGLSELKHFYMFAVFMSSISLLLWYFGASYVFGKFISLISVVFIGTTWIYLRYIESMSDYSYDLIFTFAAVFTFFFAMKVRTNFLPRIFLWMLTWFILFLQADGSPEWIVFMQVLIWGYLFCSKRIPSPLSFRDGMPRFNAKSIVIGISLLVAPIVSFLTHFIRVMWANGSVGNIVENLILILKRRTTGLDLVHDTQLHHFNPLVSPGTTNGFLSKFIQLDFIQLALLLVILVVGCVLLGKKLSGPDSNELYFRIKMLVVFLIGTILFWMIFARATITLPDTTFRLALPFLGLLIGMVLFVVLKFLILEKGMLVSKVILATLCAAVIGNFYLGRLDADVFEYRKDDLNHYQNAGPFLGNLLSSEIYQLSKFVEEKTGYGDIIFTSIDFGSPYNPHPAYEYLSDRRFEVVVDTRDVNLKIQDFERVRRNLPSFNPASNINYYVLVNNFYENPVLVDFYDCIGGSLASLDLNEWWAEGRGIAPVMPLGLYEYRNASEANIKFKMFKINPQKSFSCSELHDVSLNQIERSNIIEPSSIDIDLYSEINILDEQVVVSSSNRIFDPSLLADDNPDSYWHVEFPPTSGRQWLEFPVSEVNEHLDLLRVMPRVNAPDQFWDDQLTLFEGRRSDGHWESIGKLQGISVSEWPNPEVPRWVNYVLPKPKFADKPFDKYRISTYLCDFNTVRMESEVCTGFLSLAELAVFSKTPLSLPVQKKDVEGLEKIPLEVAETFVSSEYRDHIKGNLYDSNPDTFWHAEVSSKSNNRWIEFNLEVPLAVVAIEVMSRRDARDQLWNEGKAVLQANKGNGEWKNIARLGSAYEVLSKIEELELLYVFDNKNEYSSYRLWVDDQAFLSLAEVSLYQVSR